MPRLTAALVLLLMAACGPAPPPAAGFRSAVPIYSNATFDASRLAGTWHQSAAFAAPGAGACASGRMVVQPGLAAQGQLCLDGRVAVVRGVFKPSGPGRVRIATPVPLDGEWWMLWVDVDYRTLAIGTPDGRFGMILNRDGPLPADRLQAARELFDFNGYDLSRLVTLP